MKSLIQTPFVTLIPRASGRHLDPRKAVPDTIAPRLGHETTSKSVISAHNPSDRDGMSFGGVVEWHLDAILDSATPFVSALLPRAV